VLGSDTAIVLSAEPGMMFFTGKTEDARCNRSSWVLD